MNTLEKEFTPYEESLELKQLGFDEPCIAIYEFKKLFVGEFENSMSFELCKKTETFPAPTFSQAFRWFREKYGYSHSITQHEIIEGQTDLLYIDESEEFQDIGWLARVEPDFIKIFKTYEEAELACLRKIIEIAKQSC